VLLRSLFLVNSTSIKLRKVSLNAKASYLE
jgi:hypothetical protein